MKRIFTFIFSIVTVLCASFGAKGADFSCTIEWDTPGAVSITLGSLLGSPTTLPEGSVSMKVTETGNVYVRPEAGYIIKSVTDKSGKEYKISGYQSYGGQYVGLSCYSSSNGNVYTVTTEKLVKTGEIELNVVNGEDCLLVYLEDKENLSMSTFNTPKLRQGVQQVDLTPYDRHIVISNEDGRRKPVFSIKKNGENIATELYTVMPVASGDKIEICAYDVNEVIEKNDVTFDFTPGSEGCINSIFNRTYSKLIEYSDIKAAGNKIAVNKGSELRFNFNEDFIINSVKCNGKDVALPTGDNPYVATIEENTVFTIDATAKVYNDIEGTIYISGPVEGLVFRTGIMDDDVDIPISGGEVVKDDVVFTYSNGTTFTVEGGTARKYTIMIPGKKRKYFYDALPGYWIKTAILGNPRDPDYNMASAAVTADESPLYVEVAGVANDTKAIVFYDGEENAARFFAQNPRFPGHIEVDGIDGQNLVNGYTEIGFDSAYHESFSVGKSGGLETNELIVYLDGKKLSYDDDSMSYSGIKLNEGSVLKVFSVVSGSNAQLHTVKFTKDDGCDAEVTYDKVKIHNMNSQLECIGKTLVSVKPSDGASVTLDGELLEANAEGCYEFMTSKSRHTVAIVDQAGVDGIEADGDADTRVYNLQGVRVRESFESLPAGIYIMGGKKIIKK